MPKVGKKKFPYTKEGKAAATEAAEEATDEFVGRSGPGITKITKKFGSVGVESEFQRKKRRADQASMPNRHTKTEKTVAKQKRYGPRGEKPYAPVVNTGPRGRTTQVVPKSPTGKKARAARVAEYRSRRAEQGPYEVPSPPPTLTQKDLDG